MDTQLQNSNSDGPIIRLTAADRVATFQANANSIYNKYTPFTANSIGPSQPFVYTKISASTLSKNLTKYDSPAFPIGSTIRDLQRIGQYSVSGNGLLYLGKQLLLQNTNAFNETRIYNPLSLLKATAKPGSLGLIDYPQRHLETSGGILNFFKDALLSTIGIQSKNLLAISTRPIEGTATGEYSNYAKAKGGARAGLIRYKTGMAANTNFNKIWISKNDGPPDTGFSLAKLGNAFKNKLISLIPSTNPMGAFGGRTGAEWIYRPEYTTDYTKNGNVSGVYRAFLDDTQFLTTKTYPIDHILFYNDESLSNEKNINKVTSFHKYFTARNDPKDDSNYYATSPKIAGDAVGQLDGNDIGPDGVRTNNLKSIYSRMLLGLDKSKDPSIKVPQQRGSAERYNIVKDYKDKKYPSYSKIPGNKNADFWKGNSGAESYASPTKIRDENKGQGKGKGVGENTTITDYGYNAVDGVTTSTTVSTSIKNIYADYMETIVDSFDINEPIQSRRSIEAYTELKFKNPDGKETSYPSYKDIPENKSQNFENKMNNLSGTTVGTITIDKRGFAKASGSIDGYDRYNKLPLLGINSKWRLKVNGDQSNDIIFFYFYDLINEVYVPFRATITALSDQHSAEWEEINYIGRADKLFLYKGFSRDVNITFSVYANSAKEMLPMWERIDYLTGLTRPSKYTGVGVRTNSTEANLREIVDALDAASGDTMEDDQDTQANINVARAATANVLKNNIVSGRESRFIYPPMINFRVGDMYVDQPAVLSSVSINIPDDSNWESLRSDDYFYYSSPTNKIKYQGENVKSRQLPLKVDVSVSMKLLEKKQSLGSDYHFGYNTTLAT